MKIKSYKKYEAGTGEITKEYAEKTFEELLAFQGYGFCLGYDAEVEVKDVGNIPIGKLKGGEYIKAPALGMDYKWVKVINIIPKGKKKALILTLNNDKSIVCTEDHEFLCSDLKKHTALEIINNKNKLGFYNNKTNDFLYLLSSEEIEDVPVMDITVDSDEHLFYANGIAVSNCKAHATSYSVYSAVQMWLQEHYFIEYMCALLSHIDRAKEKKDVSVLNERVEYCIKHGTWIYYPDVNESGYKWQIKAGGLIAPLKNIKGFTDKDVNTIIDNRPYDSLRDFLDKTKFNNKKFETLLFANAFNKWGNIEDQYNWYYNNYFEKDKKKKKESKTEDLFSQFGFGNDNVQEESSSIERVMFKKSELEDKCMDLNGFVVHENIMMKYNEVYEKHIYDYSKTYDENTAIGKSVIYKISDVLTMVKTSEYSRPVWVLAKIQNIALNLKGKYGTFNKMTLSDGVSKLELIIKNRVSSTFKKGSVLIVPLYVKTEDGKNIIRLSSNVDYNNDIPILEEEE